MAKIMIEIPDEQYRAAIEVLTRRGLRKPTSVDNICSNAVVNGILITECEAEDCTNGDMIKAMFPDSKVNVTKYSYVVEVKLPYHTEHDTGLLFDRDWWNASYKRERKKNDKRRSNKRT